MENEPVLIGFERALIHLKEGAKVARQGWNGKDMYVKLQVPDQHSKMKRPYLYIVPSEEFTVPWNASQADLLTEDWYVVA